MRKLICATICLSLALAARIPPVQALTFNASPGSGSVGVTFVVPISITGAVDLTSWQFDLAFDPSILQANSVSEGSFLSSFGQTLFTPGVIDNGAGLVSLVADSYVDLPLNPSGDGVIANIEFTALASGVSPLAFSNVFLNLDVQGFDVANSQITVTGSAPVPEPATLVLFGWGLVFLCVRRRAGWTTSHEC